jgi:hypothetical protein
MKTLLQVSEAEKKYQVLDNDIDQAFKKRTDEYMSIANERQKI